MEMVTIQTQLLQFMIELMKIHAQINQCAEKHVTANAAENIEIEGFHLSSPAAKALI